MDKDIKKIMDKQLSKTESVEVEEMLSLINKEIFNKNEREIISALDAIIETATK
jgi:hypothetical protein